MPTVGPRQIHALLQRYPDRWDLLPDIPSPATRGRLIGSAGLSRTPAGSSWRNGALEWFPWSMEREKDLPTLAVGGIEELHADSSEIIRDAVAASGEERPSAGVGRPSRAWRR